ncbi:MAG TPA: family 10 glycosylhydrolase [Bacteroidales bacterium]|nr:family 10 glycosylhydrolase [Bacteroidales bacterium]
MKRIIYIAVLFLIIGMHLSAQALKREVRSVWLSTVWRLDWPSTTVPAATGTNEALREAARVAQKSGLIAVLEKLKAANFNMIYFQVRGMCDAFYNSQYEPWSQYLSSVRGADPGWDPLAYLIEEAHARGIEVHAWLNLYRYSTSADSHGNLTNDYSNVHPDWLLDYGSYTKILNPGLPEVRKRISDVVADILNKYDVDGIIFDDYFYVQGITDAMDEQQFQLYNPKGLSRADWRRDNVNQMVKDVQARINSIKSYVTYGISPAGVAASDIDVARKYGVDPCPVGDDWQYNGIYSDPLAWLKDGSIDYISPQLYWAINHATNDYSKLSPWWAKVSNFFGRNYYSSNTSSFTATELINEIAINRNADLNGNTGSVYFRMNNLPQATLNAFKAGPYQSQALCAQYGWKIAPTQTLVNNLTISGQILSWEYSDNSVRYSIYAIPKANRLDADAFTSPKYLLAVTYTKKDTLPDRVNNTTHDLAVAVYDRFGNEFPPRVLGEGATIVDTAQLTSPAQNSYKVVLPVFFTWMPVANASHYVWELSEDSAFAKPIVSREIAAPEFYSGLQTNIKENNTYYWRVKTIRPNALATVSEVRSFKGTKFKITSPADGTVNISMSPEFTWSDIGEGANYTLEISQYADFSALAYTKNVQTTSVTVPTGFLATSTTYYARVKAFRGDVQAISERIYFTTMEVPIPVPVLINPANEATVYGSEIELSWQEQVSKGFRAELSQSSTFPTRGTTLQSVDAFVYSTVYGNLNEGTYYLRVRAKNSVGLTEPSAFVTVYLKSPSAIQDRNSTDFCSSFYDKAGNCHLLIYNTDCNEAHIETYAATGMKIGQFTFSLKPGKNTLSPDLTGYAQGFYFIKIKAGNNEKTIKIRK